ncbi:YcdB/YcdC domain-containing protein [Clostridium ganghwense]|uniref:YcdB/YcdC repeated domain-containing protein n=1 Tax=Clostridium ganghwense TaxID=312089 RepID=A0ABT4CL17_9CLOT|nr:YcdB/YcdC domain-containing protein [Clostridium ganghwense]MCY6369735.1 hypothetical protein [Clostridium ganghwense]
MNKEKIFSLILTGCLVLGTTFPAFAVDAKKTNTIATNNPVSKDNKNLKFSKEVAQKKAKELLQKYFDIKIDDKDFKCNLTLSSYKHNNSSYSVWNIYWHCDSYNKETVIEASLDANTGTLISMHKNEYSKASNVSIPKLSIEEAQKISDNVIKNTNPSEYKLCELSNNKWFSNRVNSSDYSFHYVRNLFGAKYYDNYITVTVNGLTGKIKSYNFNWDKNIKVPPMPKIDLSKVCEDKFKNEMNVNLKYNLFKNKYQYENKENTKNIKLVYEPSLEKSNFIDATTGEFIKDSSIDNYNVETIELNPKEKTTLYNKYKNLENYKKPLEKAEALKLINIKIAELYGKGYTVKNLDYREYDNSTKSNENKTWTAHFTKELESKNEKTKNKEPETKEGYIRINALNGEIVAANLYSYFDYNEKFTPKFTWKEGYYKAIDLLGKYYPSRVKNIDLKLTHREIIYTENEEKEPERFYRYHFTRKVNNIPYDNDSIYIEFNTKTGELSEINCSWDDNITFQSPNKKISVNKAKETYFNKYKPELRFIWQNTSKDPKNLKRELKLVYALDNKDIYVNAFNSKLLNDYDGEEIKFDISEFLNEIKGSKAEKEIKILAYKGLIDTKDFKLKKEVKNMDLIKTLVDALGYTPYLIEMKNSTADKLANDESNSNSNESLLSKEDYLKMAKYYGFIGEDVENFDADKKVSRETMCKALIKFLNYETIAECKDTFVLNAKDSHEVSKENFGYVALAKGLNLIDLENNKVKPKSTVTMEDLSLSLFRALENKERSYGIVPMYR